MAIEGATTKEVFEAYVEHFLAPTLKPGQLVVMDNLGAHRRGAASSSTCRPTPRTSTR